MKAKIKSKKKNPSAVSLGRKGGKAYFRKHGKKRMRELGRLGGKARWLKKNEHE